MSHDLIAAKQASEWEVLDAEKPHAPLRMFSSQMLAVAMGFDLQPSDILTESPPCAHHALSAPKKIGGPF